MIRCSHSDVIWNVIKFTHYISYILHTFRSWCLLVNENDVYIGVVLGFVFWVENWRLVKQFNHFSDARIKCVEIKVEATQQRTDKTTQNNSFFNYMQYVINALYSTTFFKIIVCFRPSLSGTVLASYTTVLGLLSVRTRGLNCLSLQELARLLVIRLFLYKLRSAFTADKMLATVRKQLRSHPAVSVTRLDSLHFDDRLPVPNLCHLWIFVANLA